MNVLVGSTNPVKIDAARAVFARIDPTAQVSGQAVASGVAAQPWGEAATRQGAVNRARAALSDGATFGVGFEGGVVETEHGLMTCAWCAVTDAAGRLGLGGGVYALLPPTVQQALRDGRELGPAMDDLTGGRDTKQGPGAVGILTAGLIDRQGAYEQILMLALAPFRTPQFYPDAG